MTTFYPNARSRRHIKSSLTLVGALLACTLLLVYFMPRESRLAYEYEQGRPWRYNSLIATFDFPIYKTIEQVKAESDSALRDFQPFYKEDASVGEAALSALRKDFMTTAHNIPRSYLTHIVQLLEQVYAAGITPTEDMQHMAAERTTGIRVVEGTEALSRPLGGLYTTRSAYEYIMHADTVHFSRNVMVQLGLNRYLHSNLSLDSAKTNSAREDVLASVSQASGMVQSGQRIIDRGEIVSAEQYRILQSLEQETMRRTNPTESSSWVIAGQTLFVLSVLVAFIFYLKLFRKEYLYSPHTILLLSSLITIFPVITYVMVANNYFSVYLVPYAMIPIFVRIFMDSRTAFMALICSTLLSSLPLHTNYEFVLIQIVAGLTAIYALKELTERSQLLRVVFAVFVATAVIMLGYDLAQGTDLAHLDRSNYVYCAIGGVLLLFAYPLLYLLEKLFGFTSSVTLVELSNTNNTVLRRMSKVAQGTFVHSLQVANLSAEVANKLGAKPQLVRTGALYHDIGKMLNPAFFTENQTGVNPHDDLTEEQSAQIIIGHVREGLRLAEKYHLPRVIRDFISTHHGRSQTKFFYLQWKQKHPGEEPDLKLFTYPGPNPFTLEQAILMMCDAVEAASRSLQEHSEEALTELVGRIVDGQVKAGYFQDCPITFRDINEAKKVLVESLKTVYHTRIAYPDATPQQPAKPAPQPRRPYFFGRRLNQKD